MMSDPIPNATFTCNHCGLRRHRVWAHRLGPNFCNQCQQDMGIVPTEYDCRGFTLIELLVVITIILIVSVLGISVFGPALASRQMDQSALLLQSALSGARDAAARDNAPNGFRFLPDPQFTGIDPATGLLDPTRPLAYNRMIPIRQAPSYSEGLINTWNGSLPTAVGALAYPGPATPAIKALYSNTTALMCYQAYANTAGTLNSPTNWSYNIRVGDQIQINGAGPWLTIVGPMVIGPAQGNTEMFVNWGAPGVASPLLDANGNALDFLLLVNGTDDNKNGWIDEGWDGVDNDGVNGIDDIGEWIETETWPGSLGGN